MLNDETPQTPKNVSEINKFALIIQKCGQIPAEARRQFKEVAKTLSNKEICELAAGLISGAIVADN